MEVLNKYFGYYLLLCALLGCFMGCEKPTKAKPDEEKKESISVVLKPEPEENEVEQCAFYNETSSLGIGLVKLKDEVQAFEATLFKDRAMSKDYLSFRYNSSTDNVGFCAKYHSIEYGIFHLVCTDTLQDSFEVILNFDDKSYVSKNSSFEFISWEDYILQATSIRPINNGSVDHVFTSPDINSAQVPLPKERLQYFCILGFEGEWIKVQYNCLVNKTSSFNCEEILTQCPKDYIGWIRWKDSEKLLITIPTNP